MSDTANAASLVANFQKLKTALARRIVGQEAVIEQVFIAIAAGGHSLLEGSPGLAKTLLVKTWGTALGVQFARTQFTPDLLPSDVVGTMIFQPKNGEFSAHRGPIFANLVLARRWLLDPNTQGAS